MVGEGRDEGMSWWGGKVRTDMETHNKIPFSTSNKCSSWRNGGWVFNPNSTISSLFLLSLPTSLVMTAIKLIAMKENKRWRRRRERVKRKIPTTMNIWERTWDDNGDDHILFSYLFSVVYDWQKAYHVWEHVVVSNVFVSLPSHLNHLMILLDKSLPSLITFFRWLFGQYSLCPFRLLWDKYKIKTWLGLVVELEILQISSF